MQSRAEHILANGRRMLVTHGDQFTKLHLLLYTVILTAATLLPFALGMSGWIYLISVLLLDALFLFYAVQLYRAYTDALSRRTFKFSIIYLTALFAAMLIDHYAPLIANMGLGK